MENYDIANFKKMEKILMENYDIANFKKMEKTGDFARKIYQGYKIYPKLFEKYFTAEEIVQLALEEIKSENQVTIE